MTFPFLASLILVLGLLAVIAALFLSIRRTTPAEVDPNLPDDFGPRLTSRRLRYVRWVFALLVLALGKGLASRQPGDQAG